MKQNDSGNDDAKLKIDLLNQLELEVLHEIFLCNNPYAVEAAMGYAEYISRMGIHRKNALLAIKILSTNNRWVVNKLIDGRNPFLLFANVEPTRLLIQQALEILRYRRPGELLEQVLTPLLGLIDISYKVSVDGFAIFPLSITDINTVGKYLKEEKTQEESINHVILRIMDNLFKMGQETKSIKKRRIADYSMKVRLAFLDESKNLEDVVPEELLVRDNTQVEIRPTSFGTDLG